MSSLAAGATALLQAGILLAIVPLGQVVVLRHLPAESVPAILRRRVGLSTRLQPWLLVLALAMALTGLGLRFA